MPYVGTEDLPESIRHALPEHAQQIYRAAFNAAWTQHADDPVTEEGTAHRIAWAAVKRRYRKSGRRWVPRDVAD